MSEKIRLIYTPEGGSKQEWEIDLENPAWDITYGTEKETGWPWGEFGQKLSAGSVIALRALLWVLRKRNEPRLSIGAVQVLFSEIDLEDVEPEPEPEGEAPKES